ncbi:MAG: selenocysteine-specific translation elongation factor [Desulfobacteraceae bacterium]|nr:selenocysteine-specific translation elongation factor [Desulfobacteraceae bacterium]
MKQFILGTAGHIDHGKTSLIRRVTGIDTDRLKEEKLREITIELGFAHLCLTNGQQIGIVDVPGHEKFVKNMVAGITGIDLVAMVIAADEGIMPQTREHLEICSLLGIQNGLIVLTKVDMVDEEWLEMVRVEVQEFTRNTFLDQAPMVLFSAHTGQGVESFINAVEQICAKILHRPSSGIFRLPIDRVFSMKGFGTVITGTLASGKVSVGEPVNIYPSGMQSKIRGIQVHGQSVETAYAGMRTAINFQGLDKAMVERGNVASNPDALIPSYMVDVVLNYLPSNEKPLKDRRQIRFHTGTSEVMGIVILLDRDQLRPGQTALAQIRLDTPVTLIKNDPYVLRSYSPVRTIAGGAIINPIAKKHKRHKDDVINQLSRLANASPEDIALLHIENCGFEGCSYRDLRLMVNLPEKKLDHILQNMMSKQQAILVDKEKRIFIHTQSLDALENSVYEFLTAYHTANPLKQGMPKEELKSRLPDRLNIKVFTLLLNHMLKEGKLAQTKEIVHLPEHKISLGEDEKSLRKKIIDIYLNSGITPPFFKEVIKQLDSSMDLAHQVLELLLKEAILVKVKEDLYYHNDPLAKLKQKLIDHLVSKGEISTPQFKDMTGASRKFVIALIEHFDSIQLTIRVGDMRQLRKKAL